jgi:hypothetical protein
LKKKDEEDEAWDEGDFGEVINDEGKEEKVKLYKAEARVVKKVCLLLVLLTVARKN